MHQSLDIKPLLVKLNEKKSNITIYSRSKLYKIQIPFQETILDHYQDKISATNQRNKNQETDVQKQN